MKAKTKVTVGLCVKNSEKTVKEAINSIINQTYPSELMEMIVVDGGSKDKTLSIITDMSSNTNMRVEICFDDGKGLGAARQIVVDNAKGNYIIFVDGDVELLNDFVQRQVKFMEQSPKVGTAVGRYMHKEGTLVATLWNLYHSIAYNKFVGNDATIYRIEALRRVGGFDKNIKGASEDLDVIARIQLKGWMLSVNKEARFYHNSRETWRGLWIEQKWFGYGQHYVSHKHKGSYPLWHNVPLVSSIGGLRLALEAYKLMRQKKSFLIPLLLGFRTTAWWFGFVKGHLDGYGHRPS